MQEPWVQPPGSEEDPPEKEVANHFRILTWKSPGPEGPLMGCSVWGGKSRTGLATKQPYPLPPNLP